eukprot:1094747-Rhodomonas_salina.1
MAEAMGSLNACFEGPVPAVTGRRGECSSARGECLTAVAGRTWIGPGPRRCDTGLLDARGVSCCDLAEEDGEPASFCDDFKM